MDPLTEFGQTFGTDKVQHGFCAFYHRHLGDRRDVVQTLLEIGVQRGASLQMWHAYFARAEVHGFDLWIPDTPLPPRLHLHAGDQAKREDLERLMETLGGELDVIVDDGGHTMEQQQVSLVTLMPHVRPGGAYIVEDLHTSFLSKIDLFLEDRFVGAYETGAESCQLTTYALLEALLDGRAWSSEFVSDAEMESLVESVSGGELFDRDGDRQHMTAILYRR